MNNEVSDYASTKPRDNKYVAKRMYHVQEACLRPYGLRRLVETTNMVKKSSASKASGRIAIKSLGETAMNEGILHIQFDE